MSPIRKVQLLLVEDTRTIRLYYKKIFENAGFDVLEAEDGQTGLKKIYQETPDIILLDLILPDIQGLDILKKIKADSQKKDIPVIVLTSLREIAAVQKALQLGANYYSVKGSDSPEKLLNMIYKLLKKALQQNQKAKNAGTGASDVMDGSGNGKDDFDEIEFL